MFLFKVFYKNSAAWNFSKSVQIQVRIFSIAQKFYFFKVFAQEARKVQKQKMNSTGAFRL